MTSEKDWKTLYQTIADLYEDPEDLRMAHVLHENCLREGVDPNTRVFLIGVPDDRGVVHSRGRPGSARGPELFRTYFSRWVAFEGAGLVCDLGDIPVRPSIAESHEELSERVKGCLISHPHALVVVIGGGHDYAFGEIEGLIALNSEKGTGIANLDAHLDVRPTLGMDKINSGTAFRRLWETYGNHIRFHLTLGAQRAACASAHLAYLQKLRSKVVFADQVLESKSVYKTLHEELDLVFSSADQVSVNLDMDVFSATHAPGVSAPSVIGLPVGPVLKTLCRFALNPFLKTLGVYELNPTVDLNDQTSRLAALMVYEIAKARVHSKFVVAN
jgi:formiminoglutamase